MDRRRWLGLVVLLSTLGGGVAAASAIDEYRALRELRPDGRTIPVENWTLARDVFDFRFDRGTFHLLDDVAGRTVGAVFLGEGRISYAPADPREVQQLRVLAGNADVDSFADGFRRALFLFTDGTAEELKSAGETANGPPSSEASSFQDNCRHRQKREFRTNFELRIFQDLMNRRADDPGVFLGFLDLQKNPFSMIAIDPLGADQMRVGENAGFGVDGPEEAAFVFMDDTNRGFVYLAHRKEEMESGRNRACRRKMLVDAQHYRIRTVIEPGRRVSGETTLTFKTQAPGLRVLPIRLMLPLRLREVTLVGESDQTPLAFVQEEPPTDLGSLEVEGADAAVVFPEPLGRGETVTVQLTYAGDEVLEDAGDDNYYVGSRSRWYPATETFSDWATYDLEFFVPEGRNIVSVGEYLGEAIAEGRTVSRWRSTKPIQVAGFNYGKFQVREEKEPVSGTTVQVHTNTGTPSIVHEINRALQARATAEASQFSQDVTRGSGDYEGFDPGSLQTAQSFKVSTESLAQAAMVDGTNAMKLYHTLYGPQPHDRVALTQQSNWSFGQSWPTLVYLPYLAFISATDRAKIFEGRDVYDVSLFVDSVSLHEMAHQWWGNHVGWESYRDQWLSEGLAEFSAVIALESIEGPAKAHQHWANLLRRMTEPGQGSGSLRPYEVGPVTQGVRLATRRSSGAYSFVVYNKGAFIFQTLRMLMRDTSADVPDRAFFDMLKDFAATYGGRNPTTEDFKRHVEKHMMPGLNAKGDGSMDWFFDQWVYGTELPAYEVDVEIGRAGGKSYRIAGSVRQKNVSDDFIAMVPFYIDFGKGQTAMVAKAPFVGDQTREIDQTMELPEKPREFRVNAGYENPYLPQSMDRSASKNNKKAKKKR